jgi:hypothetical protein
VKMWLSSKWRASAYANPAASISGLKSSKGKIKWKTKHIELDTQLVTYFSLANAIGNVKEN